MEWQVGIGLDSFLLAATSIVGGIFYVVARDQGRVINNLQNAPVVSVGPTLKALVEASPDKTLPYIAINGQVKELGSQIIRSASGLRGVLQSITVNEHSIKRYASGSWGTSIREIVNTRSEVPFGIKGVSGVIVEVINPFSSQHRNVLSVVKTDYAPSDSGIMEGLLGFVTGNRSVGVETTENLLPIDANITAVGKLVMSGRNKYSIMTGGDGSKPYILTTSLSGLISLLEGKRQAFRAMYWICFTLGLAISAHKLWDLWKAFEERRRRDRTCRQRRENEDRIRAARNANQAEADSNENTDVLSTCVVCLVNPREVILFPCGHLVCCFDCESQLNSRCPVCRAVYTDTHVAFMA